MGFAVQVVREILSTGGAFAHIDLSQTSQGYLTPQDFHEALLHRYVSVLPRTFLGGNRRTRVNAFSFKCEPGRRTFEGST